MTYFCERLTHCYKKQLQDGLLAQLVRDVKSLNPVQAWIFSVLSFRNCISNYNNMITKSKGGFLLSRNFQVLVYARKFHTRK